MGVDYRIHILIICNFVIEGRVFTKNLPLSKKFSLWNILREVRQTKLIIDLSRIPVNKGTNSRLGWTKYSDLYEIVHPSLVFISLCLLTGA